MHNVQTGSGAHPASYLMDTRVLSLGEKRPGHEADPSPPSTEALLLLLYRCSWNSA
jgi:hypothetical protein